MKLVLVRIIKQWSNLKEYFCNFIPKQKEFKSSIRETKRYKNIRTCLDDEMTLPYLSFVVFLAHEYESFLLTFQTGKPLIHMLYHGMSTLLSNLLQHFVSKKSMYISVDGNREIKSTDYLVKLDLGKKRILNLINLLKLVQKQNFCYMRM